MDRPEGTVTIWIYKGNQMGWLKELEGFLLYCWQQGLRWIPAMLSNADELRVYARILKALFFSCYSEERPNPYGKPCFLTAWKNDSQLLYHVAFSKKCIIISRTNWRFWKKKSIVVIRYWNEIAVLSAQLYTTAYSDLVFQVFVHPLGQLTHIGTADRQLST